MVGGAVPLRYASGMLLPTPPPLPNRCWDVVRFVEKVLCEPLNRELGACFKITQNAWDTMKSIKIIVVCLVFTLTSCGVTVSKTTQIPVTTATISPTKPPSATPPQPTSTITPTLTPTPACVDVEISAPMTDSQIEYIQKHAYNVFYSNNEKSMDSIYSVNRADTVCGPGYGYGDSPKTYNVWKVVSGFIVDLKQPDKDLYNRGGVNTGGGNFVNIYAKARFISQDGKEHDYWLQLTGNPPGYWFQLARWDKAISESKSQSGLTATEILATEKNGDGTSSYLDANIMLTNGLLKVNDQFVAILLVGYTSSDKGFTTSDIMKQFVNAFEGKVEYPTVPEGFFVSVQAMIVPSKP